MAVLPPDPVYVLRCAEMGPVNSVCFHQNERLLAGTIKGNVYLWDLQTNRTLHNFEIGTNPITAIHHTADLLVTQEKGGTIKCWSLSNTGYVLQHTIEANHSAFCRSDICVAETQATLIYPHEDNRIGMLNIGDWKAEPRFLVPSDDQGDEMSKLGSISCLKLLDLGSQLLVIAGYENGKFLSWDLRSSEILDCVQLDENPMAVDYDLATNRGIVGGPGDKLTAIAYQRQTMEMQRLTDIPIKNSGINCIRIRGDQKVFSTGGWDGRIRIFSWKSLRPLAVLTEHKSGGIMDIAYSSGKVSMWNAPIMAAGAMDGQISLWDLYN